MDNLGITRTTWEIQRQPGISRDRQGKNRDSQGKTAIAREFKGHPRSSRDSQVTAVEL